MEAQAIRLLVREKLQDGRLPYDSMPRFFGALGDGQQCDACDLVIRKDELVMEGITSKPSNRKPSQFHVVCFQLWDHERREPLKQHTPQATMDQEALRRVIRRKLQDGRLPHDGLKRIWSGQSDGETCDACDTAYAKGQLLMKGVTLDLGGRPLQMHVRCFQMWDHERCAA